MQPAKSQISMHMRLLSFAVLSALLSVTAMAQDLNSSLNEAKDICAGITAGNRAAAKAAGYDVDRLCQNLSSIGNAPVEQKAAAGVSLPTPRATVSSGAQANVKQAKVVAPVAVAGTGTSVRTKDLKPFGYDLFANVPSTFAASTNIPVSPDYLLGPGDELQILFYGKLNQSFSLRINRDGMVDFPELGPLVIAGLTFGEVKELLKSRVAAQVIGTQVNISMGTLRTMQVFVLGEAYKPGAYTLSSLSTITHALMSAGGVSDIASLRNIQLKRNGKTIASLDLYDLLLNGNISDDLRLQSADVIYIPTVGNLVSIDGQVLRPAIYELKGQASVEDLIALAGGLGPKAFPQSARIQRINGDGFMTVIDVDLTTKTGRQLKINVGDHLRVDAITNFSKDIVSLTGNVNHPGDFAWQSGMRVSDVISDLDQFPPDVDLDYALLVREITGGPEIEVISFDLSAIINNPGSEADHKLLSRDRLIIFSSYRPRSETLKHVLEKLSRQAKLGDSAKIISVQGQVKFPGRYPLVAGMSLADLIAAAGGLSEGAYRTATEVTRTDLQDAETATFRTFPVSLSAESAESFKLEPLDNIFFKTTPEYRDRQTINLTGEVVFPGEYTFTRGETLSSVIERAGGFTDIAHVEAAAFTRQSLKLREQQEIERLQALLQQLATSEGLQEANSQEGLTPQQQQLRQQAIKDLDKTQAVGRLVIPLQQIISGREQDIVLEDGDALYVPKTRQEVTVIGEVQQPTSYFYDSRLDLQDYIERSGGTLKSADSSRVYLVKASGEVVVPQRQVSAFFRKRLVVEPGDTIVVPLDTDADKLDGIQLLAEVSQVIYQLSLGAAAIKSLEQ
jgi:polysaccharide export outer membrane protein